MKKLLAVLALLAPALLQAGDIASVQARAEAQLIPFYRDVIRPKQIEYFEIHDKYGQCLTTNTAVPQHNEADVTINTDIPDNITDGLHDQVASCLDILGTELETAKEYTLKIDVCADTKGGLYGFLVTAFFDHAGVLYQRSQAYGHDIRENRGANAGCYAGESTDWIMSTPGAAGTGESATGTGQIRDGGTPQAFGVIQNCTTGDVWTADASGNFNIVLEIGRQTFVVSDAAFTRERSVTRDVRANDNFSNNVNLNADYVGCQ